MKEKRLLAVVKGTTLSKARDRNDLVFTWPELVFRELLCILVVTLVFTVCSLVFHAPLEEQANPTRTPNPAKAPWYFVGLQELLVYFDPWIAGVMVPLLIVFGLVAIPYLDPHGQPTEGTRHSPRRRKFAVTTFMGGLTLWFLLIVVGYFFRGPSWAWNWPWEDGAAGEAAAEAKDLPLFAGLLFLSAYFVGGTLLLRRMARARELARRLGLLRFAITATLLLLMLGVVGKMVLRLVFGVKYVLVTPWFHI